MKTLLEFAVFFSTCFVILAAENEQRQTYKYAPTVNLSQAYGDEFWTEAIKPREWPFDTFVLVSNGPNPNPLDMVPVSFWIVYKGNDKNRPYISQMKIKPGENIHTLMESFCDEAGFVMLNHLYEKGRLLFVEHKADASKNPHQPLVLYDLEVPPPSFQMMRQSLLVRIAITSTALAPYEVTTTTGNYEIGRRADANPTTITSHETVAPARPYTYTKTPTLYSTYNNTENTLLLSIQQMPWLQFVSNQNNDIMHKV